jgi:hypothetical protein
MNNENTEKIMNAAPKLFGLFEQEQQKLANRLSGDKTTPPFYPIAFGLECGDGWFNLLLELVTGLEAEINSLPTEEQTHFKVIQVKEKYGTLRFYMNGTDKMYDLIAEAERKSAETCELCGDVGKLNTDAYWITSRCEKCSEPE